MSRFSDSEGSRPATAALLDGEGLATDAALAAETTARQDADTALQTNIDDEGTARDAADTTLSGRLDTLEADPTTKTYVDGQDAATLSSAEAYADALVPAGGAMPATTTLDAIPAPVADFSANGHKLTGLQNPVGDQDAATKAYVDAIKQGLDIKDSVRVASTANVSLTVAPASIDGVALAANDRLLLKNQTTASENGLYVFSAAGSALNRAADADDNTSVTTGLFVWVSEGSTNADSGWVLTTNDPINVGVTSLSFTQFSALGQVTAGAALSKTGAQLDVNVDGTTVEVNADALRLKDGGVSTAKLAAGAVTGAKTGFVDADHFDAHARVEVQLDEVAQGARRAIDFETGTGIAFTVVDDAAGERVKVKIDATGDVTPAPGTVDAASLGTVTDGVTTDQTGAGSTIEVKDLGISTAKLADDSVTAAKIAANAVGSSELADNAVDTAAIQALAVTGAKIANDTITATQIAANAVGASELADAAVDTAALADGAVTSLKIADGTIVGGDIADATIPEAKLDATLQSKIDAAASITGFPGVDGTTIDEGGTAGSIEIKPLGVGTAQLADSAVTSAKIADGTITGTDIANDTITATQIAANAVGASELADNAVDTAALADGAVTAAKLGVTLDTVPANAGDLDIHSHKIVNVNNPTSAQDAATKDYVDTSLNRRDSKQSVRAGATANVNVASAPASIDGVALAANDRVLLTGQTAGAENGLYVFSAAASALVRATDADDSSKVTSGMEVWVSEGTNNAGTTWRLTTADPITLGTTVLAFTKTGAVSAGSYPGYDNSTIDASGAGGTLEVKAASIGIAKLDTEAAALELAPIFGNGSDGAVTLGTDITLTRDMYYTDLDTNGHNIVTSGNRIFCRGTFTGRAASIVSDNGGNASGSSAGINSTGAYMHQTGFNGIGVAGTQNQGGASANLTMSLGKNGGQGGSGATIGAASAPGTVSILNIFLPTQAWHGVHSMGKLGTIYNGGTAGSAGSGSTGGQLGGGSGAGGGVVVITARFLVFESGFTISANGGNGGNAVGTNCGGGGGGGGGSAILTYRTKTDSGMVFSATGGSGGTHTGTGTDGAGGTTNTTYYSVQVA